MTKAVCTTLQEALIQSGLGETFLLRCLARMSSAHDAFPCALHAHGSCSPRTAALSVPAFLR